VKRILLVVDDEEEICRLFQRALREDFDEVLPATTAQEADEPLGSGRVTHLVCDYRLGPDDPSGEVFVLDWRRKCPSIRYAALFTGTASTWKKGYEGVDDVFFKPEGFQGLLRALRTHE